MSSEKDGSEHNGMVLRMKSLRGFLAAVILITASCENIPLPIDRYEIKEDKLGRTIRLDKRTGEISFIDGDKGTLARNTDDEKLLSQAKWWTTVDLPQLGKLQATMVTSWREGKMFYRFALLPKGDVEFDQTTAMLHRFTLEFLDSGGFKTVEIPVSQGNFKRIINDKGEVMSMEANESVPCAVETYLSISNWNVSWQSF